MNWGTLKSLASKFAHRTNISLWDEIQPLALDDINLALIVQENEASATLPLAVTPPSTIYKSDLPADYVATRSVFVDGREYSPVDMTELLRGPPKRGYAISGMQIAVRPAGVTLDLVYSTRIAVLASDGESNFLSERYSSVYLYGLCKHAAILAQDLEMQGTFENQFLSAITTANTKYMDAAFGPGASPALIGGRV